MSRVPFVCRTRQRVWLCTLVALVATGPQVAWGFAHYQDRTTDALLMWGVVLLALIGPPLIVRRLFRHRMANARLRTAEADLLGLHRVGDIEGWEIPGRYLQFLRGGSAELLVESDQFGGHVGNRHDFNTQVANPLEIGRVAAENQFRTRFGKGFTYA